MNNTNTIFYSNKCEGSKHLLYLLKNEGLLKYFKLECTDNNPKNPPEITVTPTLIIKGIPKLYIAGDAFVWLAKIKQWRTNILMQRIGNEQQKYLQSVNNNINKIESDVLGYSDIEMNSMSDIFSCFSENIKDEYQDSLPQSYFICGLLGKELIETQLQEDNKLKEKEQKLISN